MVMVRAGGRVVKIVCCLLLGAGRRQALEMEMAGSSTTTST